MLIYSPVDYITMPWKNGGGETCQLAVSEQCHPDDQLPLWRLSIATVSQDGPFSLFEHYQRCIMLLEGAGMRLRFNQQEWISVDTPLQRQIFSGQWQTDCELIKGTIKDFNLMVDQRLADFAVDVLTLQNQTLLWPDFFSSEDQTQCIDLIYVISGECDLEYQPLDGESSVKRLPAKHTLVNRVDQLKLVHCSDDKAQIFIARVFIR